jgi:LacI family transcriptional regulator
VAGKDHRRVTSRDIAREAGVSQPTVSRALRGDPRVAPETVAHIRETALALGYVPHAAARSLITSRSGTVAVAVADLTNPFYPVLVEALRSELKAAAYQMILIPDPGGSGGPEEGLDALVRAGLIDGAIVATATLDRAFKSMLGRIEAPVVLVVRDVPGSGRDTVTADNVAGGAMVGRLLGRLGHRRIASIPGPSDTSTARERLRGFRTALKGHDVQLDPDLVLHGPYSHVVGVELGTRLMQRKHPPTAIFCGNDIVALGVYEAARSLGVSVPEEISIVGFDDIYLSGWNAFRLTTVHQPLEEMARRAAQLLVRRLTSGGTEGERIVFPVSLVERDTTRPPPR